MGEPICASTACLPEMQKLSVGAAGKGTEAGQVKTDKLDTREPFTTLFPINRVTLEAIAKDMKGRGFDPAAPIVTWDGIVIDGHTRLEAARMNGITDVPTVDKEFADEDEAIAYAIHAQRARRNLTDADIVRLVGELDKRRTAGRPKAGEEKLVTGVTNKKSSQETADMIGVNRGKVEKARAVLDKAAPEVKAAVVSGDMTINKAYQETRTKASGKIKTPAQEEAFYAERAKEEAAKPQTANKNTKPCDGLQFARMAILDLKQIKKNDTEREDAFNLVKEWINENE